MMEIKSKAKLNPCQAHPKSKGGGFTLLEVLIIITILMIFFIPVLSLLSSGLIFSREADETLTAMSLASGKIEELNRTDFDYVQSEPKGPVYLYPKYSREVIAGTLETSLKDLEVTVYWILNGQETSLSLKTLKAKY
ncbi:MAG: hypothetical protein NT030_00660 [Candidatus Saganbacteria bacterium]|nr:hypothetical protein [Candidatus Saganbacteria bacterium]